ncbi:MAG TPA: HlyD family secretion protein [Burkholderiales bacterium]|nr:HlyD family secretion protein [Burkholderiales bacterium]
MKREAASLAQAVRSTKSLFAETESEAAEVASLKAQKAKLLDDLSRYEAAEPSGAVSALQVSDAKDEISILKRKIEKAQALLRKANALVSGTTFSDNPRVLEARAEYVESYIDCRRSSVYSPVDGYVADREVQAGERVKTGQRLLSIVPLDELWITANLKETKLAGVRTGQAVRIHAFAYGDFTFHGKVISVDPSGGSTFSLFPPNNATGNYIHIVERVPVRISLSKSELGTHPLRPGMSVSVSIETGGSRDLKMLATEVDAKGTSYSTDLYDGEMRDAQESAREIIMKN